MLRSSFTEYNTPLWYFCRMRSSVNLERNRLNNSDNLNSLAASATLHCLTGCAVGEIVGLMVGTALGLATAATIALAIALAFLFGYTLSTLPLLKAGLTFVGALGVVLAADTLSIAVMEIVDNLVMALIPGAMDAGLVNPIFWIGMILALSAAFVAAFPVNRYLLTKGKGHALTHQYHPDASGEHSTNALAAGIIGFLLSGLVVSIAAELEDDDATPPESRVQQPPDHRPLTARPCFSVRGRPHTSRAHATGRCPACRRPPARPASPPVGGQSSGSCRPSADDPGSRTRVLLG